MSLISTLHRTQSADENEEISRRIPSVYQQDGQPLSKEALYKYKMKYNSFQLQNVNSEEHEQELKANRIKNGNIAAQLAVKNTLLDKKKAEKLSDNPLSPEEHYKRLLVSPNASYIAASKSHSLVKKNEPTIKKKTNSSTLFSHENLVEAANKAASKNQYKIDKGGNLKTSDISSQKMDLSKLKVVATDKDLHPVEEQPKKFNLSKLLPQATKNADKLESQRKVSNIPIPIQGLKTKHELDPLLHSQYEIESLTLLASKLADERILESYKTVNGSKHGEKALFTNEEWNRIAVELVTKNKEQILSDLKAKQSNYESQAAPESVKTGKDGRIYKLGDIGKRGNPEALISLGNGLTLTQGEVTKLANKLMLPVLTAIDSDTKRQLIKHAEIEEDKKTFKVETVVYKEDYNRQQKREKAREVYEKTQQRKEDKLVSQAEKLEQKGEKIDMSSTLQEIKGSNDAILTRLEQLDVIAVDQAKKTAKVSELKSGLSEVELVLAGLNDDLSKVAESENVSDISAKQIQQNKYSRQLLSSKILKFETQRDSLLGFLALEKSKLEDLSQHASLLETSNEQLQSAIDMHLEKLEHLKEFGRSAKTKQDLLANLRRENQINLRSKQIFIRSNFNKDLAEIISQMKQEDDLDLKNIEEKDKAESLERSEHKKLFENVQNAISERKAIKTVGKPFSHEEVIEDQCEEKGPEPIEDTPKEDETELVEEQPEEVKSDPVETKKENEDFELASNSITEDDVVSELAPPAEFSEATQGSFKEVL